VAKDFRELVRDGLQQSSSKLVYFEHDSRHYLVCRVTDLITDLQALLDNQALLAITDYRWEGASMISFGMKEDAALFYLCS
jgi:hypothetical protein